MDAGPDVRPGEEKAGKEEGKLHAGVPTSPTCSCSLLIVAISQCKQVSGEELMDLKSLVRGLPSCVLKKVKATKILNDKKALKKITKSMRKSQLKAMLQGVSEEYRLNVGCLDKTWKRKKTYK